MNATRHGFHANRLGRSGQMNYCSSMSLVLCDATANEVVFLADTAKPTGGKTAATIQSGAKKVFLAPSHPFVIGLARVLPLPWGNSYSQPELWIENFFRSQPASVFTSPEDVAKAVLPSFKSLGELPFTNAGRLLIGGFCGAEAAIYEVFLRSLGHEPDKCSPLDAWSEKRDLNKPVVRGLLNSWQALLNFSCSTKVGIPKEPTERTNFFRDVLQLAIQRHNSEGEKRVALPVINVSVSKPI